MQVFELDDACLHWRDEGPAAGTALVFANSLGTDLRLWDYLLPYLPEDMRKIRFDMRGHGLSSGPPPHRLSIERLANDAAQLLDSLQLRLCVFIGTSIGGMVGQYLAVTRPDLISRLILTNTAPKMGEPEIWQARIASVEASGMASIADGVLTRWFAASFLEKAELCLWRNMLLRTDPEGYVACCAAIAEADISNSTRQITQKTLVVAGAEDEASPPTVVEAMANQIADADFRLLAGVGHLPSVEAPQELAQLIRGFLKETRND